MCNDPSVRSKSRRYRYMYAYRDRYVTREMHSLASAPWSIVTEANAYRVCFFSSNPNLLLLLLLLPLVEVHTPTDRSRDYNL